MGLSELFSCCGGGWIHPTQHLFQVVIDRRAILAYEIRYSLVEYLDMTARIEKATIESLDTLLEMGYELFVIEKQFEPLMTFSKKEARERYTSQLRNENALLLLLYVNDEISGYCYAYLDETDHLDIDFPECELEVIYIDPSCRGRGFSSLLLSEAINWAKRKGAFRIKSDIFAANSASLNIFKKNGFQPNNISYTLNLL